MMVITSFLFIHHFNHQLLLGIFLTFKIIYFYIFLIFEKILQISHVALTTNEFSCLIIENSERSLQNVGQTKFSSMYDYESIGTKAYFHIPFTHAFPSTYVGWLKPGLNFINILPTAFTLAYPKSVKKIVKLSTFFTLSGSTSIKAARKMLMKLTAG